MTPHSRKRRWLEAALLWGLGSVLGSISVAVALGADPQEIAVGPWRTNSRAGSEEASAVERAQIAIGGLLALRRSEAIYFRATVDDEGEALDGACRYEIDGAMKLPARWWSLTAYGPDFFLIPNPERRYSYSQTTVGASADGRFRITVASEDPAQTNWIPVRRDRSFDLLLRLYGPESEILAAPTAVLLPTIRKVDCT